MHLSLRQQSSLIRPRLCRHRHIRRKVDMVPAMQLTPNPPRIPSRVFKTLMQRLCCSATLQKTVLGGRVKSTRSRRHRNLMGQTIPAGESRPKIRSSTSLK